jgi:hypothetical protein
MVDSAVLQNHLPKKEQKYLVDILGLLGPQFVWEPYIKAALQEKGAFNTGWLPYGVVDADSFFAKLKNIHDALS